MKHIEKLFITLIIISITAIFFCGCNDSQPDDSAGSSDMPGDETLRNPEIYDALENYFIDRSPDGIARTPYIIVRSYAELCAIYDFMSSPPDWAARLRFQGNVSESDNTDAYMESFFESGYIIAAFTLTSSGSYTFEFGALKNDGEIIVNLEGTLPNPATDDTCRYIYLVPVEGEYADESVKIVEAHIHETIPAEYD